MLPRTPRPMPKGHRNEPAFLPSVVEKPARDRSEEIATTAAAGTAAV